ncbi:hypothetical protein P171DRAFT_422239 [Karstenula rhodostoma CBS 690.94]|uniref:Uncharacterized protein n=1 Tax=Karstenula rhodostoma CBS 690.94 TaxID=1392251 RepID=A0A9P4P8U5_9PLEO|nr:hypothetical protein P171DRAFT_422239 [Karstenula rhodostoma CBS 690.94]
MLTHKLTWTGSGRALLIGANRQISERNNNVENGRQTVGGLNFTSGEPHSCSSSLRCQGPEIGITTTFPHLLTAAGSHPCKPGKKRGSIRIPQLGPYPDGATYTVRVTQGCAYVPQRGATLNMHMESWQQCMSANTPEDYTDSRRAEATGSKEKKSGY